MDGRRRALIVANDEYEHEGLQHLLSPAADAVALAGVLSDRQISDFDVQVVRNETAHIIQGRIEDIFLESRPDDVLLLHFSCHGLKSESGELFFAARNTRPNRLGSTAIAADFVQRCMRVSRSRSIVLLLDCCYGGAFSQGVAVRAAGDVNVLDSFPGGGFGGRGRAVITASSSMEYAFEGDQLASEHGPRPSVFTAALVEGLATGEADLDEDGWISLSELYEYIFDRVRERNPNQTPSRDIEMQGELYLARSKRRRIRPLPIPADLQAATTDSNMFTRLGSVSELHARLASDNLPVAAGAHEILTEMARTDIRNVAEAATMALREAAVHVAEDALHFGQVAKDSSPDHRTVRLMGSPFARESCTFEASHQWIRLNEIPEGIEVSINTEETGILRGHVVVKGPTGETAISVDAEVTPDAREGQPLIAKVIGAARQNATSTQASSPITAVHQSDSDASTQNGLITAEPPSVDRTLHSDSSAHGAQRQPHRDLIASTAGLLAILAAVLLLIGLLLLSEYPSDFLQEVISVYAHYHRIAFYAPIMAALAFTAGGCTLLPRTRQLIGPGVLLGATAASTWGLVLLALAGNVPAGQAVGFSNAYYWPDYWYSVELIGHLILVLAACLAGFTLRRNPTAHLVRRRPRDARAWVVIILGGVGAAALFSMPLALNDEDRTLFYPHGSPFVVTAVMAFAIPACAVVAAPRRFGLSLLAGWIGGGWAIVLGSIYSRFLIIPIPISIFGCTLLLLVVAACFLARTKIPG